jgi:hypothetical protein
MAVKEGNGEMGNVKLVYMDLRDFSAIRKVVQWIEAV